MKTLKYIIGIFLVGSFLTFTSCYDMDLFPQDQLGPGTFWKTERDIQMGVAGVYSKMKQGHKDWARYWLEGISDNAYCMHPSQGGYFNLQIGNLETSSGVVSSLFAGNYSSIAACNNFMKNFPEAKVNAKISDAKANEYEAEVRFLRAWSYFELVQRYGDVPLYKEAIESVEASKVKQSPASEVYAFINEDLDFAIKNLPDEAYGGGHAVKASAQGMKARVALFRGEWDAVESTTKEIISSSKYRLADTYESIFIKREGQKDNPEILFSVTYLNPDYRHDAEREFYYWSALVPTVDLMAQYDHEVDKRAKAWYVHAEEGGKTWINPMGDLAMIEQNSLTQWIVLKHFDKNEPSKYAHSAYDFRTDNDAIIIRYADIYLMYIEAMVEKGGGTTTDANAVKYMNAIKERAGLPGVTSVTRDELRLERRRELAYEGLRHFDLIRWKTAKEVMSKLVTPGGQCRFDDRSYIWPFPLSEMDINPNLDQKAGYN
ncbi:RagB/SusD family nutrient uptake outer membrane protein [Parabacteroides sp. OttesenSCG-928-K15]|nr:RagB/SusD family nutrient uptake outer membrane protein [Parabacteroides sp. OttesenSCG-928-K15]